MLSKLFRKLFNRPTVDKSRQALALIREAGDCERRARDYDLTDTYLAGLNSGRAEILRRWAYSLTDG